MKDALLVNWDSYPNFAYGGVYTWEKALIEQMSGWNFVVVNFLSNSNSNGKYTVAPNVKRVIELPIFGCTRYEEFYNDTTSLFAKIMRTNDPIIKERFIPLFDSFLRSTISERCDPRRICDLVFELHNFFGSYDSKKCLEHPVTWKTFLNAIESDPLYNHMSLKSAIAAFQMIQRNVQLLSIELPKTDIIHCSLVWLPALVGIFSKMENKCPMIVTEHGVAFRELLLYYSAYLYDEPSKMFSKLFSQNITKSVYFSSDLIAPVCDVNAAWERMLGADERKIRVIHNGVDTNKFRPLPMSKETSNPVVVYVGRIDPFKDIVCLLAAIKEAKKQLPNLTCLIYGSSIDLDYSMRCVNTVKDLEIEDSVQFMGPTKEPEKAYNQADVVVSTSISEGFPFSVIEAMACGKPIVATDVGGVREALEGCGLLVRSRNPVQISDAIVALMHSDKLRTDLSQAAMKRAREKFTIELSIKKYQALYNEALNYQRMQIMVPNTQEVIAS
jgi:polysaccharide biosynthesis protein PelF